MKCPKHGVTLICPACFGEKHGSKGGKTTAGKMSAKERKQKAKKAAQARWNGKTRED